MQNNSVIDSAIKILEREEDWRSEPYYCSEDYPTTGFGFKLGPKHAPLPEFVLPKEAGEVWLACLVRDLDKQLPDSGDNTARRAVLLSMGYQLGLRGCLGFGNMWAAIRAGDWDGAAREALDSLWASEKQTPERARRHAQVLRTGSLVGVYL